MEKSQPSILLDLMKRWRHAPIFKQFIFNPESSQTPPSIEHVAPLVVYDASRLWCGVL